jgi:hypothetical protein
VVIELFCDQMIGKDMLKTLCCKEKQLWKRFVWTCRCWIEWRGVWQQMCRSAHKFRGSRVKQVKLGFMTLRLYGRYCILGRCPLICWKTLNIQHDIFLTATVVL